jgi:hypothetical protein
VVAQSRRNPEQHHEHPDRVNRAPGPCRWPASGPRTGRHRSPLQPFASPRACAS